MKISALIVFLALATSAYADNMKKDSMMKDDKMMEEQKMHDGENDGEK